METGHALFLGRCLGKARNSWLRVGAELDLGRRLKVRLSLLGLRRAEVSAWLHIPRRHDIWPSADDGWSAYGDSRAHAGVRL